MTWRSYSPSSSRASTCKNAPHAERVTHVTSASAGIIVFRTLSKTKRRERCLIISTTGSNTIQQTATCRDRLSLWPFSNRLCRRIALNAINNTWTSGEELVYDTQKDAIIGLAYWAWTASAMCLPPTFSSGLPHLLHSALHNLSPSASCACAQHCACAFLPLACSCILQHLSPPAVSFLHHASCILLLLLLVSLLSPLSWAGGGRRWEGGRI